MRSLAAAAVLLAAMSTGALAVPLSATTISSDTAFLAASGAGKSIVEFRRGDAATSDEHGRAIGNPESPGLQGKGQNKRWGAGRFQLGYENAHGLVLDFNGTSSSLSFPGDEGKGDGAGKPKIGMQGFNALALLADGRKDDTTITNLEFNGISFGSLVANDGISYLILTGFDISSPWVLSGDIQFGVSGKSQLNRGSQPSFEVKLAEVQPISLPAAGWSLLAALAGLGMIGRRRRPATA